MWDKIYNPITKRKVFLKSKLGKDILNKYLSQIGGSSQILESRKTLFPRRGLSAILKKVSSNFNEDNIDKWYASMKPCFKKANIIETTDLIKMMSLENPNKYSDPFKNNLPCGNITRSGLGKKSILLLNNEVMLEILIRVARLHPVHYSDKWPSKMLTCFNLSGITTLYKFIQMMKMDDPNTIGSPFLDNSRCLDGGISRPKLGKKTIALIRNVLKNPDSEKKNYSESKIVRIRDVPSIMTRGLYNNTIFGNKLYSNRVQELFETDENPLDFLIKTFYFNNSTSGTIMEQNLQKLNNIAFIKPVYGEQQRGAGIATNVKEIKDHISKWLGFRDWVMMEYIYDPLLIKGSVLYPCLKESFKIPSPKGNRHHFFSREGFYKVHLRIYATVTYVSSKQAFNIYLYERYTYNTSPQPYKLKLWNSLDKSLAAIVGKCLIKNEWEKTINGEPIQLSHSRIIDYTPNNCDNRACQITGEYFYKTNNFDTSGVDDKYYCETCVNRIWRSSPGRNVGSDWNISGGIRMGGSGMELQELVSRYSDNQNFKPELNNIKLKTIRDKITNACTLLLKGCFTNPSTESNPRIYAFWPEAGAGGDSGEGPSFYSDIVPDSDKLNSDIKFHNNISFDFLIDSKYEPKFLEMNRATGMATVPFQLSAQNDIKQYDTPGTKNCAEDFSAELYWIVTQSFKPSNMIVDIDTEVEKVINMLNNIVIYMNCGELAMSIIKTFEINKISLEYIVSNPTQCKDMLKTNIFSKIPSKSMINKLSNYVVENIISNRGIPRNDTEVEGHPWDDTEIYPTCCLCDKCLFMRYTLSSRFMMKHKNIDTMFDSILNPNLNDYISTNQIIVHKDIYTKFYSNIYKHIFREMSGIDNIFVGNIWNPLFSVTRKPDIAWNSFDNLEGYPNSWTLGSVNSHTTGSLRYMHNGDTHHPPVESNVYIDETSIRDNYTHVSSAWYGDSYDKNSNKSGLIQSLIIRGIVMENDYNWINNSVGVCSPDIGCNNRGTERKYKNIDDTKKHLQISKTFVANYNSKKKNLLIWVDADRGRYEGHLGFFNWKNSEKTPESLCPNKSDGKNICLDTEQKHTTAHKNFDLWE